MIVAASPHTLNRSETIRTLRFASTAKKVKNKAKINRELTKGQLMRRIEELEAMNAKLSQRVIELETQMRAAGYVWCLIYYLFMIPSVMYIECVHYVVDAPFSEFR